MGVLLIREKTAVIMKPDYMSELYGSAIILKNLSLVHKNSPVSADYTYEVLMRNSERLKPLYQEMLTMYRNGKNDEAFRIFGERTGTREGKNFAVILSKLERINPSELLEQIDVFQEMILEERTTASMKKAQRNSIITTAWATAGIFAMLINFLCVVVLMNMLEMLREVF